MVPLYMAEKYPIGEPTLWDTSTVRKMKRITILKPLLTGSTTIYVDEIPRKKLIFVVFLQIILVFIYDPECSHCRESAPKLAKCILLSNRKISEYWQHLLIVAL
jgi:protein-disulfide isomerase